MSVELTNYLPLSVMRFPNPSADDADVEEAVLAEVVSHDDGSTELAFNLGRKRYYIAIRHSDIPMLLPPAALEPRHDAG